jgi:hypothetical protein
MQYYQITCFDEIIIDNDCYYDIVNYFIIFKT